MSLKDRIIQAMEHGRFGSNAELARAISKLAKREIPTQSIQKLVGPDADPKNSALAPYIAKACRVGLEWLTTGEGSMEEHAVRDAGSGYGYVGDNKRQKKIVRLARAAEELARALADLEPGSPERQVVEDELGKQFKSRRK